MLFLASESCWLHPPGTLDNGQQLHLCFFLLHIFVTTVCLHFGMRRRGIAHTMWCNVVVILAFYQGADLLASNLCSGTVYQSTRLRVMMSVAHSLCLSVWLLYIMPWLSIQATPVTLCLYHFFLVLLHTDISICILYRPILIFLMHISAFRTCHTKNAVVIINCFTVNNMF